MDEGDLDHVTVRPIRDADLPVLRAMAEQSGHPYPDLSSPLIECVWVAVDEQDRPVMACAVERIVQLYLYASENPPAVKLSAVRALHEAMAAPLRDKGYSEVNAFLPPVVAKYFGRRLERTFGWARNWPSWCRKL